MDRCTAKECRVGKMGFVRVYVVCLTVSFPIRSFNVACIRDLHFGWLVPMFAREETELCLLVSMVFS